MKKEDFERLKTVCQKEGFELRNPDYMDIDKFFVIAKKKDIWEGVEFVQSISPTSSCTTQWKTYKVKQITERSVWIEINDHGSTTTSFLKEKCKPSTESAYVDQFNKKQ